MFSSVFDISLKISTKRDSVTRWLRVPRVSVFEPVVVRLDQALRLCERVGRERARFRLLFGWLNSSGLMFHRLDSLRNLSLLAGILLRSSLCVLAASVTAPLPRCLRYF